MKIVCDPGRLLFKTVIEDEPRTVRRDCGGEVVPIGYEIGSHREIERQPVAR